MPNYRDLTLTVRQSSTPTRGEHANTQYAVVIRYMGRDRALTNEHDTMDAAIDEFVTTAGSAIGPNRG